MLKYIKNGVITLLSLCGIAFILLTISNVTGGISCKSRSTNAKIELLRLDRAIEEYILDIKTFPTKLAELYESEHLHWMGPYTKRKDLTDPWGKLYYYQYFPNRKGYQLYTLGKDNKVGGNDSSRDQISEKSLQFIQPPLNN